MQQSISILNQKSLICQQEVIFSFVEILMLGLGPNVTMLTMMLNFLSTPLYLILEQASDIPPILHDAACLSLLNAKCGKQSWVKNVVNVFDWAGYSSCFSEISRCDHELTNLLMCSFRDQFLQTWTNSLQRHHSMKGPGGNKLRTHRLFKHVFELESYLSNV